MEAKIILPPNEPLDARGLKTGGWWHSEDGRIVCDLCPRLCSLKEGDRGFCFVRQNVDNKIVLTTYGRSTGFCIDPIEKKPLNHFYPGTSVLSFGTAGCNLGCKFCQNWDISKSREIEKLSELAMPADIVEAAKSLDCRSVAFTYNDPVVWAEYAIDTAKACREAGIKSVAVTAGYITPEARGPFYEYIDAVNVDLKAFNEEFYHHLTLSHLEPVLETLCWLKQETDVWFEITNLIIPQANDDPAELRKMCDWILENVGDEVPVHFTAFHPDYRMQDRGRTPHETLIEARETALKTGLKFVYAGNVSDVKRQSTYCPNCEKLVIERNCYVLGEYALDGNNCCHCRHRIPGHFDKEPGTWGQRRLPVDMRKYSKSGSLPPTKSDKNGTGTAAVKEGTIVGNPTANRIDEADPAATESSSASQQIELSDTNQTALLSASSTHVTAATQKRTALLNDPTIEGLAEQMVAGVFVSLKRSGQLRACCGTFGQMVPLQQALAHAARRSATSDPRFPPISPSELPHLQQEVWLLHAPEAVQEKGEDRVTAVTVGVHGLQIIRGDKRGLLLPGVPVDHGWDAEQFLNQTCVKAGLSPADWKDDATILMRFEGQVVRGPLIGQSSASPGLVSQPLFNNEEMTTYAQHCRHTLTTLLRGGTPLYYCPAVPDAEVNGMAILVGQKDQSSAWTVSRQSIQQKMPLQATLFSLCEQLVRELLAKKVSAGELHVDFAVTFDPAMHGTVSEPDLNGFDPKKRCLLIMDRGNTGLVFDVHRSAQELLSDAVQAADVTTPATAQIFSLAVHSTQNPLQIRTRQTGTTGGSVRPAAVAGTFYPSNPQSISTMLDSLLEGETPKEKYAAAMVPHAGWVYSGRIAVDVLKRIELPRTIIAIGPKHTPHGVEWAVAPHQTWSLPGINVESDIGLARQLAAEISGLELDAAAHQREHGIEVELPIIARLSPQSRVVGITIGRATLQQCNEFADGLAGVINRLEEKPFLLISSDMNHFATDQENRRLDEMALQELDRIDPDALYKTVMQNKISMCGLLPAIIILKTLDRLKLLHESQRVGYATSADVSGDSSRVVGYAGMLFR